MRASSATRINETAAWWNLFATGAHARTVVSNASTALKIQQQRTYERRPACNNVLPWLPAWAPPSCLVKCSHCNFYVSLQSDEIRDKSVMTKRYDYIIMAAAATARHAEMHCGRHLYFTRYHLYSAKGKRWQPLPSDRVVHISHLLALR